MHITCARGFIAARGALQLSVRFDARQRPLSEFARPSGGRDGDASERLKNAKERKNDHSCSTFCSLFMTPEANVRIIELDLCPAVQKIYVWFGGGIGATTAV